MWTLKMEFSSLEFNCIWVDPTRWSWNLKKKKRFPDKIAARVVLKKNDICHLWSVHYLQFRFKSLETVLSSPQMVSQKSKVELRFHLISWNSASARSSVLQHLLKGFSWSLTLKKINSWTADYVKMWSPLIFEPAIFLPVHMPLSP